MHGCCFELNLFGCAGTHPLNVVKICQKGLLRVGHPLNPSKRVDEGLAIVFGLASLIAFGGQGFFGKPEHGIYVSRYVSCSCCHVSRDRLLLAGRLHVQVRRSPTARFIVVVRCRYGNSLDALSPGESMKIVMLRVLPGRSRHIKQRTPGLTPADSPGFDSHSSSNFQECARRLYNAVAEF